MRRLAVAITGLELPAVEKISQSREEDPFQVTIATLLSARTQDATTYAASERLFKKAATPRGDGKLTVKQIEKLIYPVSFYRYKARYIKATCAKLMKDFGGKTPSTMEELLTLPGVGRKTANLVLILAYESQKNICVDTHVHRIANRLGWVRTKTPDETEQALYRATEARWWPYINLYLVTWGQNVCRPVYPRCPACAIKDLCPRIGVTVVSKTKPESYPLDPAIASESDFAECVSLRRLATPDDFCPFLVSVHHRRLSASRGKRRRSRSRSRRSGEYSNRVQPVFSRNASMSA